MDWIALTLSLKLGVVTMLILLPVSVAVGRWLAYRDIRGKALVEAALALPLVLPPTVIGYYLLTAFGLASPLGRLWQSLFGQPLAFSFAGLLAASVIVNLPFAIQPAQRAFESIPRSVRDAAAVSGLTPAEALWRIDLPLAWPGIVTGMTLTFAHTLGEFGVVLMVGGSIPGETRTAAIAIYDRVQAFDDRGAALLSSVLLLVSIVALTLTSLLGRRKAGRRG